MIVAVGGARAALCGPSQLYRDLCMWPLTAKARLVVTVSALSLASVVMLVRHGDVEHALHSRVIAQRHACHGRGTMGAIHRARRAASGAALFAVACRGRA